MADGAFVYVLLLVFTAVKQDLQVCSEQVPIHTFYKEIRVDQFSNFGSLQLLDVNVPPLAVSAVFDLRGLRTPQRCPVRNISVYWQYGSIPVAEYNGKATFPKNFILRRSSLNSTSLPSSESQISLEFKYPLAGTWFFGALVEKQDDQVIKKLNTIDCSYWLQMNVTVNVSTSIDEIMANKTFDVKIQQPHELFRFFVGANVYRYSVNLTCNSLSHCPYAMSSRALGIPSDSNDSVSVNCSAVQPSTCVLWFPNPVVDQWHYLKISSLQNHGGTLALFLKFYECNLQPPEPVTMSTAESSVAFTSVTTSAGLRFTHANATSDSTHGSANSAQNSSGMEQTPPTTIGNAMTHAPPSNNSVNYLRFEQENGSVYNELGNVTNNSVDISTLAGLDSALPNTSNAMKYKKNAGDVSDDDVMEKPLLEAKGNGGQPVSFPSHGRNPRGAVRTSESQCVPPARFSRVADIENALSTVFSLQLMSLETMIILTTEVPFVMRFDLDPMHDIGTTLKFQVEMHEVLEKQSRNITQQTVALRICVQRRSIPLGEDLDLSCSDLGDLFVLTLTNHSLVRWFPYPEPGPWFFSIQKVCYANDSTRVQCPYASAASFKVVTSPCVNDGCSNGGICTEYEKSVYTLAACRCNAGYRGFGCDDASGAASDELQRAFSFMLSMSNLVFIPAIVVACVRRRFPEMVVYFANMFFSSFYHACDMSTWSRYKLCIMPYHVLSFCDFYCSMLSFWVTLVAMARLPAMLRPVAHMVGAVALAMAMKWSMHNFIADATIIGVGVLMVFVSLTVRCGLLKRCYPHKKSYLWALPGIGLAIVGVCLFAFVQSDANYPYTHSAWHLCMSISIVFLLPRSKVRVKDEASGDSSSFQLEEFNDTSQLVTADFSHLL